jgi:transposase
MVVAQMVVDSVVLEGRSVRATAQRYGVSNSWVHELVRRYRVGGADALVSVQGPSPTPGRSPSSSKSWWWPCARS